MTTPAPSPRTQTDQMTTPTSPDRLPEAGAGRLAPTIDAIVGGDFSRSRLTSLSDLDRNRADYLRQRWLDIPSRERHALILAIAELADESLDFNFNRVYRIALEDPDPLDSAASHSMIFGRTKVATFHPYSSK